MFTDLPQGDCRKSVKQTKYGNDCMRKYWSNRIHPPKDFPRPQISEVEKKHNIKVIRTATENVVDELFLKYHKDLGFETVFPCGSPDYIGIKTINGKKRAFTIELEVTSYFFRLHNYLVDYIVCLEKDDEWYGIEIIEFRKVLGVKEFVSISDLDYFLYENDEEFKEAYDSYLQRRIEKKMGLTPKWCCDFTPSDLQRRKSVKQTNYGND